MAEIYRWERTPNTAMKVFSKLYVGFRPQKGVPLGFATPYEENAAGRKRQATVDNWSGSGGTWDEGVYVPNPKLPVKIIDNEPEPGFKITDDVKRVYWGGGNVVWRVEDPRGFELEIQSQNLMALIQSAGIQEGGVIPGKCVWGRSEGINILLHETSDEYKAAFKAAETLKAPKKLGKKDRRVGGLYTRADGTLAIYLGVVHVTVMDYPEGSAPDYGSTSEWFKTPEMKRNARVAETVYPVKPSVVYEAMLEVDTGTLVDGRPSLGNYIKLYKQAPLVTDEQETYDLAVTNEFLRELDWQFASSSVSYARIVSVTTEPVNHPSVVAVPWTEKQYLDKKSQLLEYIKQYCKIVKYHDGEQRRRWPADRILGWKMTDVLIVPSIGPMSAIGHVGADQQYITPNGKPPSQTVALPCHLGAGYFIHRTFDSDAARAMDSVAGYHGLYNHGGFVLGEASKEIKAYVLPEFATQDEFMAWFDEQYNAQNLCNITVVEDPLCKD